MTKHFTFVSFTGLLVSIIHWHRWHPDPVFGSRDHPLSTIKVQAVERQLQEPSVPPMPMFLFRVRVWFVLDMSSMLISTRLFFELSYVSCDVAWSCTFRHVVLWTLTYVLQSSVFVTAGSDGGEKATCRESATCFRAWTGQVDILFMAEILHQLIDSLSHYFQGFIPPFGG